MKVAVLGANGMLGARVVEELGRAGHDVTLFVRDQIYDLKIKYTALLIAQKNFDWVVNCAGIVKSRTEGNEVEMALVNAAMPHWLEDAGARVLQISTDCVFSGEAGNYVSTDNPDPVDLYGATKLAGELQGPNSITVRTSFIGWEDGTKRGLLEWFVRQNEASGFANAMWSGLSAREVARAVSAVLRTDLNPRGGQLYHLAGEPISKCSLLRCLKKALKLDVDIMETFEPHIDRTMHDVVFESVFGYKAPSWEQMAEELARERPA